TRLQVDLQECDAALADIADQLQRLGAVDPREIQQAQQRHAELSAAKTRLTAQLTAVWEEALPLGLLGQYRQVLAQALLREEAHRQWEDTRAALEPKIPQLKTEVFAEVPAQFVLPPELQAYYTLRLETALQRLYSAPQVAVSGSLPFLTSSNAASVQIRTRLADGVAPLPDLVEVTANLDRLKQEFHDSDLRLKELEGNSSALEAGAELYARRGELTARQEQLRRQLEHLRQESEQLQNQLQQLKREEATQRELVERAEQGQSLASLAGRYREAAARIQTLAAVALRERLAAYAGELWVDITERDREFRGMSFDEHWNCYLVRRDGTPVCWEETNTSAGQRQVRMLAFYEALRRLGKLVPPLVVDTPLARLDKEVRESVLNRLYLNGHQSILLTTNAEIDPAGPLFADIKDRLARVYTIAACGEPEEEHYEVRVTRNYFGREL
ncbi:MAG TPA: hypothetical protein VNZ22_14435, partial [Bacillota bacterium]|nr:hypothetical protein [Bacillota bacterium]